MVTQPQQQTVTDFWLPDAARRRLTHYKREPATGQVRIVEVLAGQDADLSDIPQGVTVSTLPPQHAGIVTAYAAHPDDPQAGAAMGTLLSGLYQQAADEGGVVPPGMLPQAPAGGEQRALRATPADIAAQTARAQQVVTNQATQDELDQAEHTLRQKAATHGLKLEDFLPAERPGGASGAGGAPAGGGQPTDAAGLALSPDYVNAYTARAGVALQAGALGRRERLQAAENALNDRIEGADWLTGFGDLNRQIEDDYKTFQQNENLLSADPRNDKSLGLYHVGGGKYVSGHAESMGLATRVASAQHQREQLLAQRDPAAYVAEKKVQVFRSRRSNPDYVNQSFGIKPEDADLPENERRETPGFSFAMGGVVEPLHWQDTGLTDRLGALENPPARQELQAGGLAMGYEQLTTPAGQGVPAAGSPAAVGAPAGMGIQPSDMPQPDQRGAAEAAAKAQAFEARKALAERQLAEEAAAAQAAVAEGWRGAQAERTYAMRAKRNELLGAQQQYTAVFAQHQRAGAVLRQLAAPGAP